MERSAAVLPANFDTKRKRFLARSNCIAIRRLCFRRDCPVHGNRIRYFADHFRSDAHNKRMNNGHSRGFSYSLLPIPCSLLYPLPPGITTPFLRL